MRFKAAYDTLDHRLKNGRRIWGKNTIWTLVKFEMDGWARQLSMIRAIFRSSARNSRSSLQTHFSKISLFIQLFFCNLYSPGRCLTFLKQRGFLDFQITNMGSFSPVALAAAIPVSLTLLLFFPFLLSGDILYLGDIDRKDRTRRNWKYLPTCSLKELLVRDCFAQRAGHLFCNGLGFTANDFQQNVMPEKYKKNPV